MEELQKLHSDTFGKNGTMTARLKDMKNLAGDARAALNAEASALRDAFRVAQDDLETVAMMAALETQKLDAAAPFDAPADFGAGRLHPLTMALSDLGAIFKHMGYGMRVGPEIEDDWHNFAALNVPLHHPARDMQDTFFVEGGNLLRTHTSAGQIRAMEKEGVPIKIFCPGATYRVDMDATHFPMFHQIEGLVIGSDITLSDLVKDLKTFLSLYFGLDDVPLRIRPSYFPFTEPSVEIDIKWDKKAGKLGQGGDWLEIVPGGMVHPNVLCNVEADPDKYQGFAFGLGLDRMAMLKYGLPDGRKFFEGDIRWIKANGV